VFSTFAREKTPTWANAPTSAIQTFSENLFFKDSTMPRNRTPLAKATLEAIDESKAQTYAKWNFQRFVEGKRDMYIPLATIRKVLGVS
jgi:hypothetical protein